MGEGLTVLFVLSDCLIFLVLLDVVQVNLPETSPFFISPMAVLQVFILLGMYNFEESKSLL